MRRFEDSGPAGHAIGLVHTGEGHDSCSDLSREHVCGSIKDNARAAHIPLDEWLKWKAWNKP
ncbi:hypothetical protein ACIQU3_21340 [Streptomyces sp. NPDC101110]|uniref:hypothetical protein n=1 Tax=unclassified Streptomyces TaxID=2593676 RepID=UPI00380DB2E4